MTSLPFPAPAASEEEVRRESDGPLLARARPPLLRAYFAAAAARELAIRERRYPERIAAGTMAKDDADGDLECWRVIAALFLHGSADTHLPWSVLELATSRAHEGREAALAADPGNADLLARRDAVWGIHERISWQRWSIDDLNTRLRARAARTTAEAA